MREILCFGDSNTYGYIPGGKGRYGWNVRWTSILADRLYAEEIRVTEEGLCGRTTVFEDELREDRKGSDLLPALLESHKPLDTVILMLGTNDCKSYYHASAEVIGLGVEKLIGQINNRNIARICGEDTYCLGAEKISQVAKIQGASIKYCYGDEIAKWNKEVFQMLNFVQ